MKIGDVSSSEGFWASGKQFFRRNPGGFQGKIAPSRGQKTRRLGMLTFFKQALKGILKGQALGAMPGALLCPLSQNFLSHIRLEGVAGQKVHFDFKSRRLTVLYWGDHSFAHLWEKPHSVNSVKSSSSGGSSEKRTDLTSDFSPLQAIPQSSPGCGGKDLPLSPHWWSEKRRYPSP